MSRSYAGSVCFTHGSVWLAGPWLSQAHQRCRCPAVARDRLGETKPPRFAVFALSRLGVIFPMCSDRLLDGERALAADSGLTETAIKPPHRYSVRIWWELKQRARSRQACFSS